MLTLDTFKNIQCLQVPILKNIDANSSESFLIEVTASSASVLPNSDSVLVTVFDECVDGEVRLVDGTALQGRVQMCYDGVFGYVCDIDDWSETDAQVVCTQLGYIALTGNRIVYKCIHTYVTSCSDSEFHSTLGISGPVSGPIVPGRFGCEGDEMSLLECSSEDRLPQVCTPNSGVECFAGRDDVCTDGEVRLVGTNSTSTRTRGRAEICYRSQWGSICDDDWDDSDAAVVCTQLNIISGM